MAKTYVYYNVTYPHIGQEYNPYCFACAVRKVVHDFRVEVQLQSTDFEHTKCKECECFINDQIEI